MVLAFLIGGGWVTFVTWVTEKYGSDLGGFFGGLPSTMVFTFFFIGWIESTQLAVAATTSFPLFMGFTVAFLFVYSFFTKWGFAVGLIAGFAVWFLAALSITLIAPGFVPSLLGYVVVSLATYYGLRRLKLRRLGHIQPKYTMNLRLLRFAISGGIIIVAVLASQVGGPVFGAVFSAFPAVFTSTLYTVSKSLGTEFSRGMTTSLMLSAIFTVVPYSIAVRYLYPSVGIWFGTVAAYAIAIAIGVVYYRYGRPRLLYSPDRGAGLRARMARATLHSKRSQESRWFRASWGSQPRFRAAGPTTLRMRSMPTVRRVRIPTTPTARPHTSRKR